MSNHLTRRALLARSAGLAAGLVALPLFRPAVSLAQPTLRDEELVEDGERFRRGTLRGASIVATPEGPAVQAAEDGGRYSSVTLQSSIQFTHVGLHWRGTVPSPAELSFELRTSSDGQTWSSWQAVKVERLPDETPVGDYFGYLVYAGGARFLQYRATFRTAGGPGPSLRRVTATVIDSPAASVTTTSALTVSISDPASGRELALTSRQQWGADERYRFSSSGKEIWREMFVPCKKLVVHHTATRNDYASLAESIAEVRAIYRYHAVTQRWGDIGYNALIDKFGNLFEGRHGRGGDRGDTHAGEYLSAGVVAGHDASHNYGSAGVALLGDATREDWQLAEGDARWTSLVSYGDFECGRHFLRPLEFDGSLAASDFLRSNDTWTSGMRNLSGHQETNATACPGTPVMNLLSNLRQAIHAALTAERKAGVFVQSSSGREVTLSSGLTLNVTWSPQAVPAGWEVTRYEYCFEGWYKPSDSEDIQYLSGYDTQQQPAPRWVETTQTSASLPVSQAGHYTLHVRAVLQNSSTQQRSVYEGNYTYLVKPSSSSGGGRKPKR